MQDTVMIAIAVSKTGTDCEMMFLRNHYDNSSRVSTGPTPLKFNEKASFFQELKKRPEPPRGRPAGGGGTYHNWGYGGINPH